MKHHCYVQALWAEAKCAGDQRAMTCQSHAPPLKSLCRETDSAASLQQMLWGREQGKKCQWWADELQVSATLALIKLHFEETSLLQQIICEATDRCFNSAKKPMFPGKNNCIVMWAHLSVPRGEPREFWRIGWRLLSFCQDLSTSEDSVWLQEDISY